jgi:hypothetical protein
VFQCAFWSFIVTTELNFVLYNLILLIDLRFLAKDCEEVALILLSPSTDLRKDLPKEPYRFSLYSTDLTLKQILPPLTFLLNPSTSSGEP